MSLIHIEHVTDDGWTVMRIYPTERISVDTHFFEIEGSKDGEEWWLPLLLDEYFASQGLLQIPTHMAYVTQANFVRIRPIVQEPERKAS